MGGSTRTTTHRPAFQQSEYAVRYALEYRGVTCRNVGHLRQPWDIETANGIRIDVKDSQLRNGRWTVNLRRKGSPRLADFYVVCLRGLQGQRGFANRVFVILDARDYLTQSLLIWTVRSLLNKHAGEVGAWHKILEREHGEIGGKDVSPRAA
jgi:hypothetical protein